MTGNNGYPPSVPKNIFASIPQQRRRQTTDSDQVHSGEYLAQYPPKSICLSFFCFFQSTQLSHPQSKLNHSIFCFRIGLNTDKVSEISWFKSFCTAVPLCLYWNEPMADEQHIHHTTVWLMGRLPVSELMIGLSATQCSGDVAWSREWAGSIQMVVRLLYQR